MSEGGGAEDVSGNRLRGSRPFDRLYKMII
jgi:hypothetical protein